jgi:kinesin family protein 2/24
MALKECIRNRALAAINSDSHVHIPYRNTKLTLLLKDTFELFSNKHSKAVIIANVGPSFSDLMMTKNTLRFIQPIKIGASQKVNYLEVLKPCQENPATWTNEMLKDWIQLNHKSIDLEVFCPFETGKQILTIQESDFVTRILNAAPKTSE